MKALNLKSMSWIMALAMMFIVSFTGCSSDNDETGGSEFKFPEQQEVTGNANGTVEISFEATADWKLTSNAGWCKFANGDFTESTISGKAGKQVITAKISNDGQNYSDDNVAEITLTIGGKSQVIYKITRPKKVFNGLTVKDAKGNIYDAEHPIVIKGSGIGDNEVVYTSIIAESEFTVGVESAKNPDWIKVESAESGKFSLTFNNDNKDKLNPKYSFGKEKEYSMTFGVQTTEGTIDVPIPVIYEGLKEGILTIEKQFFNLKVSLDGKKMINNSGLIGSTSQIYKDKIATTITTRNDEYQIVKFEQKGYYAGGWAGMAPIYTVEDYIFENANTEWAHETRKDSELSLVFDTFTPNPEIKNDCRGIVVMAFPKKIYDEIKDDLKNNIIVTTPGEAQGDPATVDIASKYTTYVIATVVQEDLKLSFSTGFVDASSTFYSIMNMGMGEEPLTKYNGNIDGAGTNNIYTASFASTTFSDYSEMGVTALAFQITNGEGTTIEVKNSTLGNSITAKTQAGFNDINTMQNDGKQYIVLTPASLSTPLVGKMQIAIKSGDETAALFLVEFTASTNSKSALKVRKHIKR